MSERGTLLRSKTGLVFASLASAAALSLGVGSALAVGSHQQHSHGKCKSTFKLSKKGTSAHGKVKCSTGGKGTGTGSFVANVVPPNDLKFTGTYSYEFGKGTTLKGTFALTGPAAPPGPFHGTFKIKKGTGKLKKAHGSGKMNCTQANLILHCTQIVTKGKL